MGNVGKIKGGWLSPDGELIPLLPGKEHLATIEKYAEEHGIVFDRNECIYFVFIDLGFVMFDDKNIFASKKLNFFEKKMIEDCLERKINDDEVVIFKRKLKRRLH